MKRIMILMFSILCLTACNDYDNDPSIERPNPPAQITLSIPDATVVSTYSTANVNECTIDTLWVFVFDGATGVKKWVDKIEGSKIVNNGQAAQILPQLKHEPAVGDTVVIIANVHTAFMDTSSYITCANINQYIQPTMIDYTQFPYPYPNPPVAIDIDFRRPRLFMYGEMIWSPMSGYTCTMIRAVAKIEVQLAPDFYDVTGTFNAENVFWGVGAYTYRGYLKPTSIPGVLPHPDRHTGFTYYSLLQREDPWAFIPSIAIIPSSPTFYITEYPSSTKDWAGNNIADDKFDPNRVHLILGNMATSDTKFYRLDFFDHSTGKFLDIKRNHHYIFTIRAVRSEGYHDLMLQNFTISNTGAYLDYYGSNLEYSIKIVDDSRVIKSNGQYALVVSTDTVKLPAGAVTIPAAVMFRYEDPEGWVEKVDTTHHHANIPANIIAIEDVFPSSATMTTTPFGTYLPVTANPVHYPFSPTIHTRERHITTTKKPLDITVSSNFVSGTVVFKLGNIEHRVRVVRE